MNKNSKVWVNAVVGAGLALFSTQIFAGDITVSAAASLTDAFKEIGQEYQKQYPNNKVSFNFGASGALLQQIDKGAPVDVFAAADQETMDLAQKKNLVAAGSRSDFVGNSLVLVTPVQSTASIRGLKDLTQASVKYIAIGNPATTPAGRYAKAAMEQANIWAAVQPKIINTQNVRQALDYVARGETDTGFVFGTDAAIMKGKVKVAATIPTTKAITYPMALMSASKNQAEARQFMTYVKSSKGQAILKKYGFRQAGKVN